MGGHLLEMSATGRYMAGRGQHASGAGDHALWGCQQDRTMWCGPTRHSMLLPAGMSMGTVSSSPTTKITEKRPTC